MTETNGGEEKGGQSPPRMHQPPETPGIEGSSPIRGEEDEDKRGLADRLSLLLRSAYRDERRSKTEGIPPRRGERLSSSRQKGLSWGRRLSTPSQKAGCEEEHHRKSEETLTLWVPHKQTPITSCISMTIKNIKIEKVLRVQRASSLSACASCERAEGAVSPWTVGLLWPDMGNPPSLLQRLISLQGLQKRSFNSFKFLQKLQRKSK